MVKHTLHRIWCYLAALFILSGVIAVHEAGHWVAAELNGAHCRTFNLGFGPGVKIGQFSHTEIWIRCMPFGGYVELPMSMPFGSDGVAISDLSTIQKLFVFGAGIAVNLVCGAGLLFYLGRLERAMLPKELLYEIILKSSLKAAKDEAKFRIEGAKFLGDRVHRFLRDTLNFTASCGNPFISLSEGPMNGWRGIVKETAVFSTVIGIGNLIPLAPLDGARMFDTLFVGGVLSGGRPAETISTVELISLLTGLALLIGPVLVGLLPAMVYMYRFEVSFYKHLSDLKAKFSAADAQIVVERVG